MLCLTAKFGFEEQRCLVPAKAEQNKQSTQSFGRKKQAGKGAPKKTDAGERLFVKFGFEEQRLPAPFISFKK